MRPGAAFFVCVALFSAPDWAHVSLSTRRAAASTSIELSVAELVSKSTLVLAGTPLDSRSLWEESEGGRGRRIVTYTRLRVDRLIDGNAASEVWVRTLGGEVDDIGQHVDGEAADLLADDLGNLVCFYVHESFSFIRCSCRVTLPS